MGTAFQFLYLIKIFKMAAELCHRSTADYSLDGDTVDGATVVGGDPALFNPWTHGFFTSRCLKKYQPFGVTMRRNVHI